MVFSTTKIDLDCTIALFAGNCLQLDACSFKYDRVYCGAACPPSYENYMKNFVKVIREKTISMIPDWLVLLKTKIITAYLISFQVGGILVYILKDRLLKVTRLSETTWEKKSVQPVAFATLIEPQSSSTVILRMYIFIILK